MSTDLTTGIPQRLTGLPTGMLAAEDFYENGRYSNIFREKQTQADELLGQVTDALSDGALGQHIWMGVKPQGSRWVVQMSDEMKSAIDSGALKFDTDKAGNIFAQLRVNGKFGDKLPITQEIIRAGIDPMAVSQALQMKAIEKQLDGMMDVMQDISADVETVVEGQMNDRIAQYNSGLNLYLESENIQDAGFRNMVAAQAMKSLSDSTEEILQQIRSDTAYLKDRKYLKKKGKATEDIDEHMQNINRCFQVVHKAYMLRTAIYYDRNETAAMLSALDEYGRFLKNELKEMAPVLTESDREDVLLSGGKWEKRVAVFEEIGSVKKQLAGNSSYTLKLEGKAHG